MGKSKRQTDYYDALRARFSGGKAKTAQTRFAPPPDPTAAYFGARDASDEPAAHAFFDPAPAYQSRKDLAAAIGATARSDTALAANGLRLAIGSAWGLIAGWLFWRGGEAAALFPLFQLIAITGLTAATAGLIVGGIGRGVRRSRLNRQSAAYGAGLAAQSYALSQQLDSGRRIDGRPGASPVEAELFIKRIGFTAASGAGEASFSNFIDAAPAQTKGARASIFLTALCGVVAVAIALFAAATYAPAIFNAHPAAVMMIAAGGTLYLGAGFVINLFSGLAKRRTNKATNLAMATAQAAFNNQGAPDAQSLTAQLSAPRTAQATKIAKASLDAQANAGESIAAENHDSRRDSGPIFIETGFQAAPKSFRADPNVKKMRP